MRASISVTACFSAAVGCNAIGLRFSGGKAGRSDAVAKWAALVRGLDADRGEVKTVWGERESFLMYGVTGIVAGENRARILKKRISGGGTVSKVRIKSTLKEAVFLMFTLVLMCAAPA